MSQTEVANEILPVNVTQEMEQSYLDYAMSVIVSRALPDARDGLKPVQRRILYSMHEGGNNWNRPFKKSARVVGDVIGKYHPHGDSSIYGAMVRLVQDFSMRYPLIEGQGNFGSIDADNPAAMRYTEVRMQRMANEMLSELEKETVDFVPNYDNSEKEPTVLPSKIPQLLINGSSGIAVGMATSIPPHNLSEVISGAIATLDNEAITFEELFELIPAPDFPTGASIRGLSGVWQGYRTGRGSVKLRAKSHFEDIKGSNGRRAIVFDEIPYMVVKALTVEKIDYLRRSKTIEGISAVRDESDKAGIRIVVELTRDASEEIVLNQLYKDTALQTSFQINMIALVDGYPKRLNLKDFLLEFLKHRREVVYRRTVFELKKARARVHLLEGQAIALSNVDEIVDLIKKSDSREQAKKGLLARAWRSTLVEEMLKRVDMPLIDDEGEIPEVRLKDDGYHLSERQADAILDMKLDRLTALERDNIFQEYKKLTAEIAELLAILADKERIRAIVRQELLDIRSAYGDARKSEIEEDEGDITDESLVVPEDMMVTLTHAGYIKTQSLNAYEAQKRGGRGKKTAQIHAEDYVKTLFVANRLDNLLCFTSLGNCYKVKVYRLPEGERGSRGRPIANYMELKDGEKVNAILPVKDFNQAGYVVLTTASGLIKRTSLAAFQHVRKNGVRAINLLPEDRLIGVALTGGHNEIMLFSSDGKAARFSENHIRVSGRSAMGVIGMRLKEGSQLVELVVVDPHDEQSYILCVTAKGYGKRSELNTYRKTNRGAQGVIAIDTGERNGNLVGAALVNDGDDVMLITSSGLLIRTPVNDIRKTGRTAQGVKLIRLGDNESLASIQKVVEETGENGNKGNFDSEPSLD